jgi:hypothetical protein
MSVCHICGVPSDADFFDESGIEEEPPDVGKEVVLARYALHPQYCGILMGFLQFTQRYALDKAEVRTPDYEWQLRCNGRARDPYLAFSHIINPWDSMPFPLHMRLEEGCLLEFVLRNTGDQGKTLGRVGGRIIGRYWYNTIYGGAPNRL